ncbi:acyltransferase [Streptomyces durbertensis]|uniref:Acyltransferase n=1 Tax=Streptomyces durbertensis TaxID=2448886 RepID=A0ABR6EPD8_9ACTN|nr:acyltransferase [Streptomyces durbertensis]
MVNAARDHAPLRRAVSDVLERVDGVAAERGVPALRPWLLGTAPPSARELAEAPTGTAQIALFGASVAIHRALSRTLGPPDAVVAVSFGEIAALTAAGALTVEDGARAAHDLACVLTTCPGGLTLLRCSPATARRLIRDTGDHPDLQDGRGADSDGASEVAVAVVNDSSSVVVSGPLDKLCLVERAAAEHGVTAARLRLPFSSHHPGLRAQAAAFTDALRGYPMKAPRLPVYSAVAGRAYQADDSLAERLADCLTRPAELPPVLRRAAAHHPGPLLEAGTGRALADSARRVLRANGREAPPAVRAPLAETDFPW